MGVNFAELSVETVMSEELKNEGQEREKRQIPSRTNVGKHPF